MFGQPTTPFGGFGQQTNTAPTFGGAPAPSGGLFGTATTPAPTFGQASSGFGATTGGTFGTPAAPAGGIFGGSTGGSSFGTSGFGAPAPTFGAPAATGGGIFGSATPSSSFGSTTPSYGSSAGGGMFGSAPQPSTTLFSTQPQQQPTFGSTNGFGAAPSTTSFGSAPGGMFGTPAPAPTFGAPSTNTFGTGSGLFGTNTSNTAGTFGTTPAPSFGVPAPAPSFGVPAPAPSVFGSSSGGGGIFGASTFGTSTPTPLGGGGVVAVGTRTVPYQATSRQDQNSTTPILMQDITAMQEYEKKSPEELRFEDYSQGNRGTVAPLGGGFTSSSGLFNSPAPAPVSFGTFGSTAPAAPFGSTTTGSFAPAPAGPGLFGVPAAAPFTFGSNPTPAPTGGIFGSTAPTSSFLNPAPAPTFGSTPAAPATFGSFSSATPGVFGSTTPGVFGSSAPSGTFGSSAPAPFPAPTSSGIFGGLSSPAPSQFGTAASGGGLFSPAPSFFNNPTPAPTSLGTYGNAPAQFGTPYPTAGLGSSYPQSGLGQPSFSGIQQQQQQPISIFPSNVQVIPPAQQEMLDQQLRALEQQRKELEKTDVWRGSPAKIPASTPTNMPNPFDFSPSPRSSPILKFNQRASSIKLQPRGFFPKSSPGKSSVTPTPTRRDARAFLLSPEQHIRTSKLQLVLRPESMKPPSRLNRLRLENPLASPTTASLAESVDAPPAEDEQYNYDISVTANDNHDDIRAKQSPTIQSPLASTSPGFNYYQKVIASTREDPDISSTNMSSLGSPPHVARLIPTLTKTGYEVTPSLDQLSSLHEADLAAVTGFTVARPGYGKVEWEGAVDVRGASLDKIVSIDTQDISVYSEDEEAGTKPPVGSKLNRPAVLTFYEIFPKNGGAQATEEEREKFAIRVQRSTEKLGAEFLSYDTRTGIWRIRVHHFSRYGLLLDDESDGDACIRETSSEKNLKSSYARLSTRKATPFRPSRVSVQTLDEPEWTDLDGVEDYGDNGAIVSDIQMSEAELFEKIERDAETAVKEVSTMNRSQKVQHTHLKYREEVIYYDEGTDFQRIATDFDHILETAPLPQSQNSITSRLVSKFGTSKSEVCYGSRLGRSFRVSWLPDGSFIKLKQASSVSCPTLVKGRPVLSDQFLTASSEKFVHTLIQHSHCSLKDGDDYPTFCLPQRTNFSNVDSLRRALNDLAAISANNIDCMYGFQLLLLELTEDSISEEQRTGAVNGISRDSRKLSDLQMLLRRLGSKRSVDDAQPVTSNKDFKTTIKLAVCSGDIELACALALEASLPQLAMALVSSSESRFDLQQSLLNSNVKCKRLAPSDSVAILMLLLGGNDTDSPLSNDWIHFMLRRINRDQYQSVTELVENCVACKEFPFPSPICLGYGGRSHGSNSIFYMLLRLFSGHRNINPIEVLNPLGFSPLAHDYSFSFFFAITMVACNKDGYLDWFLGQEVIEMLIDNYTSQLIGEGRWDLAIIVLLYNLRELPHDQLKIRVRYAKSLVICHYHNGDDRFLQKRKFLVRCGVTDKWFEEALAYRCLYNGTNAYEFVRHTLFFNYDTGYRAFQELILPCMFFRSKAEIDKMMALFLSMVEEAESEQSTLPVAILRLMELEKAMEDSAIGTRLEVSSEHLFHSFGFIEEALLAYDSSQKKTKSVLTSVFSTKVSLSAMVVEAKQRFQFLRADIEAVQEVSS